MSKSNFFHDFSIRELLNKNQYLAKPTPQDRMPGIGGIAGGIGGGSGCAGVGAVRSRQESFSAVINPAKAAEFDATRFIESLRADVEAEMQDSALTVTSADIFGSAGFSIDYAAPGSHGRVHIIVRRSLDSNNLHITGSVEEKRTDPNAAGWSEMS